MAAKEKAASLRPGDYSASTGLWQGRGKVVEAEFVMFDYGNPGEDKPVAKFVIAPEEGEENVEQMWSVGKVTDWMPSEDGSRLIAIGKAQALNTSSNLALLITSLVNAGFPEDKLTDDITDLVGLEAEFVRVAAPKRPGLPQKEEGREPQVCIVSEIYQLPWEKKAAAKGKATPAKGGAAKTTAKAAKEEKGGGGDFEERATELVMEILSESEDAVKKQQLSTLLFKKLKGDPDMKAIMQVAYTDDFLSSGPWSYEGGELSLG